MEKKKREQGILVEGKKSARDVCTELWVIGHHMRRHTRDARSLHRCDEKGERYLSTIRGYPYIRPVIRSTRYLDTSRQGGRLVKLVEKLIASILPPPSPIALPFDQNFWQTFDTKFLHFWLIRILLLYFEKFRLIDACIRKIIVNPSLVDSFDKNLFQTYIYLRTILQDVHDSCIRKKHRLEIRFQN